MAGLAERPENADAGNAVHRIIVRTGRNGGLQPDMNPELRDRIESQAVWTFPECLALAAEFGLKTRFVVAMIMMLGRTYVDGGAGSYADGPEPGSTPPD